MEENLQKVVTAVCAADPQLGAQWFELLGKSTPSAEDSDWTKLVERLVEVGNRAGAPTDGLMDQLVKQTDTGEVQTAIAAVVWPDTEEEKSDAGVTQTEQGAQDAQAIATRMATEDKNVWNEYLRTNAKQWDGTDENWKAFVDWFLYYAEDKGVGASARAFCDYATANGPRQVFQQYGVAISTPQPAQPAQPMSVEAVADTYGPGLFAEFREQNPELAGIDDKELRTMLVQLLSKNS